MSISKRRRREPPRTSISYTAQCPLSAPADGLLALSKDRPHSPTSSERYLEGEVGDNLDTTSSAMEKLARSLSPEEIAARA